MKLSAKAIALGAALGIGSCEQARDGLANTAYETAHVVSDGMLEFTRASKGLSYDDGDIRHLNKLNAPNVERICTEVLEIQGNDPTAAARKACEISIRACVGRTRRQRGKKGDTDPQITVECGLQKAKLRTAPHAPEPTWTEKFARKALNWFINHAPDFA